MPQIYQVSSAKICWKKLNEFINLVHNLKKSLDQVRTMLLFRNGCKFTCIYVWLLFPGTTTWVVSNCGTLAIRLNSKFIQILNFQLEAQLKQLRMLSGDSREAETDLRRNEIRRQNKLCKSIKTRVRVVQCANYLSVCVFEKKNPFLVV